MLFLLFACNDVEKHDHDHDHHDHEFMTSVHLTFTDSESETLYTWVDLEQDGNPDIDPITLNNETEYTLTLSFLNELEEPVEDFTPEILDEDTEHQVFFTGDDLNNLYEQSYGDEDSNGLPIGLLLNH